MNSKVTIIMYHYVRYLKQSRYPQIKGLDVTLFREQIGYLKKHYHFITMEMLIDSIDNKKSLPKKSILLTFDDAYLDHFTQVFPILIKNNIQGSFFPPVKVITEHTVLDVNKIHFILASCENKQLIISCIYKLLDKHREIYALYANEYYFRKLAKPNRFDTAEVIFIKRLLQVELVEDLRKIITNELFVKFVNMPESVFSRELYMSIDQIKTMQHMGMHIGSHGYDHYWLNSLTKKQQKSEIIKSIDFINEIGGDITNWTMCYPYGVFNDDTIKILHEHNCKLALTTNVDVADINKENKFTLSRLDTKDIPKKRNSAKNKWFELG